MNDALIQKLTPSQRQAVLHKEGPLLVIAGPGSGKTRVITYRIAALIDSGVKPHNICALTFTNKAADEMRQRAVTLGASAGAHISTFHSLCVRILRRYADAAGVSANFSIYNDTDQARCVKRAVKDCELDTTNFSPARMHEAISALKNNLVDVDAFKGRADDFFSRTLAKIYARYQVILTDNNALDFDDLLLKTAQLLANCRDVCGELGERFKFLLIDEYQDTNHAQYIIARQLVSTHNNICVTGDPDQSIYRWRGADIRNILDFEKDWPDAVTVKLEENFRSTPNILEPADNLIAQNKNRKQKTLIPTREPAADVVIARFEDEQNEALGIAEKIEQLAEGGASLKDIAVFYRVNAMSRVLEEAFIRSKIPYQIVRGTEFYSRKEIRDILAYLKILVNPDDEIALLRIINTPVRGIGKTTIDRVLAFAASSRISFYSALKKADTIGSLSQAPRAKLAVFVNMMEQFRKGIDGAVAVLTERVFVESGLQHHLRAAGAEGKDALDNVNELINAIGRYDKETEGPALLDYLQQVSLFSDVDSYNTTSERVAFMTLHAAKGLEFEDVFIVGTEEGILPHERTDTEDEDDLEEERRLFFVGMTRAKTGLHISYARYRTIRGQMLRTSPSQFLYELGTDFKPYPERIICYEDSDGDLSESFNSKFKIQNSQLVLSEAEGFKRGRLVRHDIFGIGTVKEFIDIGENSIITIRFNTGQTKTLLLKYANISEVKGN